MRPKTDLFNLVKSMSSAEKRFFRVANGSHAQDQQPVYLRLYGLLLSLDTYDENTVKGHFEGEPCLRQFTRVKNYLYNRILQSLRQFNANNSVRRRCLAQLDNVELLFTRQLHTQARQALKSGKSIAQQHALTDLMPALLNWERKLLRSETGPHLSAAMRELERREARTIRDNRREQTLHALYDQFLLLSKQRRDLASIDEGSVEALGQSGALRWPIQELTFEAALGQKLSLALYHRLRNEMEDSLGYYWGAVQVWESKKGMVAAYPDRFLRAVVAFLYSCHAVGDYSEFEPLLARIREESALSGVDQARISTMGLNLQLLYCLNKQPLESGKALAEQLEQELEKGIAPHSVWIPGMVNLSMYHFLQEDFKAARRGLGKLLDLPRGKAWTDLRELARLLWLPVLYELEEYELLGYALRSMLRFVQYRRPLNALEEQARRFFAAVDRNPDFVARMEALRSWEAEFEPSEVDGLMGAEVIRIWLTSRLRNVSMEAVRKELRGI